MDRDADRPACITGQNVSAPATQEPASRRTTELAEEDPAIAELLKPPGCATGQFSKNHLCDRNEFLPTVHGFGEFHGNLHHLNDAADAEAKLSSGRICGSCQQRHPNSILSHDLRGALL
jgi:arylsulfatase A-like enzyme